MVGNIIRCLFHVDWTHMGNINCHLVDGCVGGQMLSMHLLWVYTLHESVALALIVAVNISLVSFVGFNLFIIETIGALP